MSFQTAIASALATARQATTPASTVTVTLKREGSTDEDVSGLFGQGESVFEFEQDQQLVDTQRLLDLFADPADYKFDSVAVEPAERDSIEMNDGTTIRTYEVSAPSPEPAWRWSDRFNTQYRIHTKLINEVSA